MCLLEGVVSNRRTEKVIEKSVLTVPSKCCTKEPTSANTPALHGRTALKMQLKVRGYANRIQLLFLEAKPAGIPGAIKHSLCCFLIPCSTTFLPVCSHLMWREYAENIDFTVISHTKPVERFPVNIQYTLSIPMPNVLVIFTRRLHG